MNRSCLFSLAFWRTPCNPWDTRTPLCVGCVLGSMMFSLVTGLPSTTSATPVSTDLVRRLRRFYAHVRLLAGVHVRILLLASRTDPGLVDLGYQRGLPVLARAVSQRANGSRTTPGLRGTQASRFRPLWCCLPARSTRSAPGLCFSKLNSPPADASVYTSPGTSRHPAQDSRSRWFAIPFL